MWTLTSNPLVRRVTSSCHRLSNKHSAHKSRPNPTMHHIMARFRCNATNQPVSNRSNWFIPTLSLMGAGVTAWYTYHQFSSNQDDEDDIILNTSTLAVRAEDEPVLTQAACQQRFTTHQSFSLNEVIRILNADRASTCIPYIESLDISMEEYGPYYHTTSSDAALLNHYLSLLTHLKRVKTPNLFTLHFPPTIVELHHTGEIDACQEWPERACIYPQLEVLRIDGCTRDPCGRPGTIISPYFLPQKTLRVLQLKNVRIGDFVKQHGWSSLPPSTFNFPCLETLTLLECNDWDHSLFYQQFPKLKSLKCDLLYVTKPICVDAVKPLMNLQSLEIGSIKAPRTMIQPHHTPVDIAKMCQVELVTLLKQMPQLRYLCAYDMPVLADAIIALPPTLEQLHVDTLSWQAASKIPSHVKKLYAHYLVDEHVFDQRDNLNAWFTRISTPEEVYFHYTLEDMACYRL